MPIPQCMTVDVEDWFNILDAPCVPQLSEWDSKEVRFDRSVKRFLDLFAQYNVKATFFWLGWFAERHPELVRECLNAGHEIASHGYAHLLAYQVGRKAFLEDISKAKKILEDISGGQVLGFRAAGFGILDDTNWFFDTVAEAGYRYDSSVFPATRGHGGMNTSPMTPYVEKTNNGDIVEFPQSVLSLLGHRFSVFGGGYLRLAPWWLIRAGVRRLEAQGQSVIFYVHPREVDPNHPRLPLSMKRYFKCYVNLKTTMGKLQHICAEYKFQTMQQAWEIMKDQS